MLQRFPFFYNCFGQRNNFIPQILKDGECELLRNYHLDNIGSWTKRDDYKLFNAQIKSGETILGLYNFINDAGTSEFLTALEAIDNNVDVWYDNAGTWEITDLIDWTIAKKIRFLTFINRVFAFNGSDAPKSSADGITWNATDLTDAPICKYGQVFMGKIYFAGNATYPDRLYFSSLPSTELAITWATNDWIDINPSDGQNITGLSRRGRELLIFKERGLYRWNTKSVEADLIVDVGCSSQESVKSIHGITFFFGRSKKDVGVYAYTGGFPKEISHPVKKLIDGMDMSKIGDVRGEVDDDHYYLHIGDVSDVEIGGQTRSFTDVVLVHHISRNEWYYYTDIPVRVFNTYVASGAEHIYFGDKDGQIFKFQDKNTHIRTIEGEIISKTHNLNNPEETFTLKELWAEGEKLNVAKIMYRKDNKDTYNPLGSLKKFINKLLGIGQAHRIQIKISDTSKYQSQINGYSIYADLMIRRE